MATITKKFVKGVMSVLVIGFVPAWCQTALLKGKVVDAAQPSPIDGVDVIIVGLDGKERQKTTTGKDGAYSLGGLKQGARITAKYRKSGYAPDPRQYEVALSKAETIQDAKLFKNTADSTYWGAWSSHQKVYIVSLTKAAGEQARMYDMAWSDLSKFHVSPEAQVEAAKQVVADAPDLPHSSWLLTFASVDAVTMRRCTDKIEAAVEGSAKLMFCAATPPDVATEIAANEIRKQAPSPAAEERFLTEYHNLWGAESSAKLHQRLSGGWEIIGSQEWEFSPQKKTTPN